MLTSLAVAALAAVVSLPCSAEAARACGSNNSTAPRSYQHNLLEFRWDSADPRTDNQFATISASLSDGNTPLYECNIEWPESWEGWHKGGNNIIWSDCIWTGAGTGKDKIVSFAVDWRNRTLYMSHSFSCSDRSGLDGLATGHITLDLDCRDNTVTEGTRYCFPKSTSTSSRSVLSFNTTLAQGIVASNATCTDLTKSYQSFELENWLRQYQMAPASETPGSTSIPKSDTGPSFTLTSMINNEVSNCTTAGKENDHFKGDCAPAGPGSSTSTAQTSFEFDPEMNILIIRESLDCGAGSSFTTTGVGYMQAACSRDYNSDTLSCTSHPVWIGTQIV